VTGAKEYMTRGLFGNVTGRSLRGSYALRECGQAKWKRWECCRPQNDYVVQLVLRTTLTLRSRRNQQQSTFRHYS
jgi:hypothetical protein